MIASFRSRSSIVALLAIVATGEVSGAAPVEITVAPLNMRTRSEGVRIVDIDLKTRGPSLVEGTLELESSSTGIRYRTRELVLAPGRLTLRTILPGAIGRHDSPEELRSRLIEKNGSLIELGLHPINGTPTSRRGFTIAVCRNDTQGARTQSPAWQALQLEAFTTGSSWERPAVAPIFLSPDDLPSDEVAFCAFDVVLLEEVEITSLQTKQATALRRWVDAGGSLCVVTSITRSAEQIASAFEWSDAPRERIARSAVADESAETIAVRTAGLGHVIFIGNSPGLAAAPSKSRRQAIALLWKVNLRASQQLIEGRSQWHLDGMYVTGNRRDYRSAPAVAVRELIAVLLADLRLVPWRLIAFILVAFVLIIGPLDYYLLRRWHKPIWTWWLFPAFSIGCTLYLIWLPEHYLGAGDRRRILFVNDVGPRGNVVRQSRFQLEFSASDTFRTIDVQNALCTLLDAADGRQSLGASIYTGQFPRHFSIAFPMFKWQPQLLRVTSLAPLRDESGIDWARIGDLLRRRSDIAPTLRAKNVTAAYLAHGNDFNAILPGQLQTFAALISTGEGMRKLHPFAAFSPHGGSSLTDLVLIDREDPSQTALIVVQPSRGNLVMSRRLWNF